MYKPFVVKIIYPSAKKESVRRVKFVMKKDRRPVEKSVIETKVTPLSVEIIDVSFFELDTAFNFAFGFNECIQEDIVPPEETGEEKKGYKSGWLFKGKLRNLLTLHKEMFSANTYAIVAGKDVEAQNKCDAYPIKIRKPKRIFFEVH